MYTSLRKPPADPPPEQRIAALTPREREVAALISHGWTNREIAADLYLSTRTVESHVSNLLGKLGLERRSAVAALMARWAIIHEGAPR